MRSQLSASQPDIDWQQVSRLLLNEQIQRLTTNPLTHAEGIAYRTEQVYVPLGLVERKRQSRRQGDVLPEQGSLLYEETEITQKFEHEAFLEQVLRRRQSPRSGGRRIAIIGEPGAGKTTLLQQVAQWVSENIDGAIAIWVSLADLQGQELEDYLLERWLPAVVQQIGQAEASTQVKDAFVTQVQQGRVWLLLDGVDEMQVSSGNPLSEIERQVRLDGLLLQMRIVLTCRLNLWDGNRHALDTFDTYRTLEFSYPAQVEQLVERWFEALPDAQTGQAERLCAALKAPGKERIRDLVKNPLRLTLLCFNWYLGEGALPETKAGLYEQFVTDFYEWKRERFPATAEQRRRLNAALGELAREAIDKEETRFRLRHDFTCEFLGEPDKPDSLFTLALRLGWLNQVGVDVENRRKPVYAFFHPTFQEYFAALAIDDWHFFLTHILENPSHPDANYRIFELQWKETYLLWIGRQDVSNRPKEELIEALDQFEEGIEPKLYQYKALFLAASGVGEFRECSLTAPVVAKLGLLGLTFFSFKGGLLKRTFEIEVECKRAILETDRKTLTEFLVALFQLPREQFPYLDAIFILGEITPENSIVTNELLNHFKDAENGFERGFAAEAIEKFGKGNKSIIATLTDVLQHTQDEDTYCRAVNALAVIDPGNQPALEALIEIIQKSNIPHLRLRAIKTLGIFSKEMNGEVVIPNLMKLIQEGHDEDTQSQAAESLGKIDQGNLQAVSILLKLIQDSSDEYTRLSFVENLIKVDKFNLANVTNLISLVQNTQDEEIKRRAAESLGGFDKYQAQAISILIDLIQKAHNKDDYESPFLTSPSDRRRFIRWNAVISLGKIGSQNISALETLVNVIQSTQNQSTRLYAIQALGNLGFSNRESITTLLRFIQKSEEEYKYGMALDSLKATLDKTQISDIVRALKGYLSRYNFESEPTKFRVFYAVFWKCIQSMPYPDFYRVWHDSSA